MIVRTYRARNLREALGQVKADLGEDATILSTRTVSAGLFRSQLELTAALSPVGIPPQNLAAPAPQPAPVPPPPPPAPGLEVREVARFLAPLRQEIHSIHAELRALSTEPRASEPSGKVAGALDELRQMLRALQARVPGEETVPPPRAHGPLLAALAARLRENRVREEHRERVLEQVAARLPEDPAEATACGESLAAAAIGSEVACASPVDRPGLARRVALCGPAGVGKTTTLAKIATRAALLEGRSVALIGCDSERIGAVRALEDTARLLGVPVRFARTLDDLAGALEELSGAELILVDTSGHSHRDLEAIATLGDALREAKVEPLLCLNADLRACELDACLEAFASLGPRALVLTKLDQAIGLGNLLSAPLGADRPVMYLTSGRRIPDDLEAATPARIGTLVMGLHLN
jgi:flagellar biosynthesis protein FlhF